MHLILEIQNRKILEELQIKKQLLLKQGAGQALNSPLTVSTSLPATTVKECSSSIPLLLKYQKTIYHVFFIELSSSYIK